jgi:hypothetical protein
MKKLVLFVDGPGERKKGDKSDKPASANARVRLVASLARRTPGDVCREVLRSRRDMADVPAAPAPASRSHIQYQ